MKSNLRKFAKQLDCFAAAMQIRMNVEGDKAVWTRLRNQKVEALNARDWIFLITVMPDREIDFIGSCYDPRMTPDEDAKWENGVTFPLQDMFTPKTLGEILKDGE